MAREANLKDWIERRESERQQPDTAISGTPNDYIDGIPQVGLEILGGKYRVERVLGRGGMGIVVAALHMKLGGRVAFKFLLASMRSEEMVDRFLREGQAVVKIQSEHVARVLDVGVLDNGTPYLMMEYLAGANLEEYVAERGALQIEDATNFVLQACEALAVAHAAGIVHRDLKPSNLFVTQHADGSPLVKVLDFGISKISADLSQSVGVKNLTQPGTMLGSPRYMSPEHFRNSTEIDHRADIWALGVVLFELLTGRPMFDATSLPALWGVIANDAPPRLRSLLPGAPPELEAVLLKCVEKDPANRYPSVAELATDLGPMGQLESQLLVSRIRKLVGQSKPPARIRASSNPAILGTSAAPDPIDALGPTDVRPEALQSAVAETMPPTPGGSPPTAARPNLSSSSRSDGNLSSLAISTVTPPARSKGTRGIVMGALAFGAAALLALLLVGRARTPVVDSRPVDLPGAGAAAEVTGTATVTAITTSATAASVATAASATPAAAPTAAGAASSDGASDGGARALAGLRAGAPGGAPPRPGRAASAPAASAPVVSAPPRASASNDEDMLNRRR